MESTGSETLLDVELKSWVLSEPQLLRKKEKLQNVFEILMFLNHIFCESQCHLDPNVLSYDLNDDRMIIFNVYIYPFNQSDLKMSDKTNAW